MKLHKKANRRKMAGLLQDTCWNGGQKQDAESRKKTKLKEGEQKKEKERKGRTKKRKLKQQDRSLGATESGK